MPEASSLETEGLAALGEASSAAEKAGISEAEKTAELTAAKITKREAAASAAVNPGKMAEQELGEETVPQGTFDDYGHRVAPARKKDILKTVPPTQDWNELNSMQTEEMKALKSSGMNTASHSDMGLESDPLHHHRHTLKGDVMPNDIQLPTPPGGEVHAYPVGGEPPVVEAQDAQALDRPGGARAQANYADARAAQENEPIGPFRQGREANPIASTGPPEYTTRAPERVRRVGQVEPANPTPPGFTGDSDRLDQLGESLHKDERNLLQRIHKLKTSGKEHLEKAAGTLEQKLADKTGVSVEEIRSLGKALNPSNRQLGESSFSYITRSLGQRSTKQTAAKLTGATALAAGQTFQVQAEKDAAEAGLTEASKSTKEAVKNLGTAMGQDFDALGKARGTADAKSREERERQLRMLEAMARSQNTGGLAAAYQQHRNRAYY